MADGGGGMFTGGKAAGGGGGAGGGLNLGKLLGESAEESVLFSVF